MQKHSHLSSKEKKSIRIFIERTSISYMWTHITHVAFIRRWWTVKNQKYIFFFLQSYLIKRVYVFAITFYCTNDLAQHICTCCCKSNNYLLKKFLSIWISDNHSFFCSTIEIKIIPVCMWKNYNVCTVHVQGLCIINFLIRKSVFSVRFAHWTTDNNYWRYAEYVWNHNINVMHTFVT